MTPAFRLQLLIIQIWWKPSLSQHTSVPKIPVNIHDLILGRSPTSVSPESYFMNIRLEGCETLIHSWEAEPESPPMNTILSRFKSLLN